jgi:hypothetical protein
MSEIDYEPKNKEMLENCCSLVMEYKANEKKVSRETKRETRLSIDLILEKRRLQETIETSF